MEVWYVPKKQKEVADETEVAAFWTEVMRGAPAADERHPGVKDQLKATEFLAKHHGMFKESKEVPEQIEFVGDEELAD